MKTEDSKCIITKDSSKSRIYDFGTNVMAALENHHLVSEKESTIVLSITMKDNDQNMNLGIHK